jgi:hypothetical protein
VTGAPLGRGQEGTLTLTVAGAWHQVGPGQCARFPGSLPHSYAGEGTGPVRRTMAVVVPPLRREHAPMAAARHAVGTPGRHWPAGWADRVGQVARS